MDGGFGSGAAHSAAGSSGSFQHGSDNRNNNNRGYDPFYDRNSVYPGINNPYPSSAGDENRRSSMCCIIPTVLILGNLALFLGLYSPLQMEASLSYSRILSPNSLFVREVEVEQSSGTPGAYVYSFHGHPALTGHQDLKLRYDRILDSQRHHEWALWLNKGSVVTISYKVPYGNSIILAVFRGEDRFNRWLQDPFDAQSSVVWERLLGKSEDKNRTNLVCYQGEGKMELVIDQEDDYYFALGNTDYYPVKLDVQLHARVALYDTTHPVSRCSLQTQSCKVKLSPFKSSSVLLTTPASSQHPTDVWRFKASYKARWWTYIIGYGTLAGTLAIVVGAILFCQYRGPSRGPTTVEEKVPLVAPVAGEKASGSQEEQPSESPPGAGGAPEDRLCAVCLDAEKDSFFDPCGHCATCFSCGTRVKESPHPICPICRASIRTVRRIFR